MVCDQIHYPNNYLDSFPYIEHLDHYTLQDTWGFLDGTVRPIAWPIHNQHHVYNGHKRVHALKFQGLMVPNGVIVHLARPWVGRRHDS